MKKNKIKKGTRRRGRSNKKGETMLAPSGRQEARGDGKVEMHNILFIRSSFSIGRCNLWIQLWSELYHDLLFKREETNPAVKFDDVSHVKDVHVGKGGTLIPCNEDWIVPACPGLVTKFLIHVKGPFDTCTRQVLVQVIVLTGIAVIISRCPRLWSPAICMQQLCFNNES